MSLITVTCLPSGPQRLHVAGGPRLPLPHSQCEGPGDPSGEPVRQQCLRHAYLSLMAFPACLLYPQASTAATARCPWGWTGGQSYWLDRGIVRMLLALASTCTSCHHLLESGESHAFVCGDGTILTMQRDDCGTRSGWPGVRGSRRVAVAWYRPCGRPHDNQPAA